MSEFGVNPNMLQELKSESEPYTPCKIYTFDDKLYRVDFVLDYYAIETSTFVKKSDTSNLRITNKKSGKGFLKIKKIIKVQGIDIKVEIPDASYRTGKRRVLIQKKNIYFLPKI